MKVAIVHYWWLTNRGGEAVCLALLDLFPSADLYLHVCDDDLLKNTLPSNFQGSINKSLISKLPFSKKMYQK